MGFSPRKAAAAALSSGGGLTVLAGASFGLVVAEAKLARRTIGPALSVPPAADGLNGQHLARVGERPLRLAMLGDSTAARRRRGTAGADARRAAGPVRWSRIPAARCCSAARRGSARPRTSWPARWTGCWRLRTLKSLKTPERIQKFLDTEIAYNKEPNGETMRSPRRVLRDRVAHCMEGAMLRCRRASRPLGHPPFFSISKRCATSITSSAIFRQHGRWGAITKSNYSGLGFREPVYRTLSASSRCRTSSITCTGSRRCTTGRTTRSNSTYTGNEITKIESAVSQCSLTITWSYPSGATYPHVATVATDDATAGNSSTAITWQYHYSGDQLTSACNQSQANVPCTTYSYTAGLDYPAAVEDTGPTSYWRLDETSGSVAASSVLANEGADNGTYVNPQFNFASSPLYGEPSSVQVAGFTGTSSTFSCPRASVMTARSAASRSGSPATAPARC